MALLFSPSPCGATYRKRMIMEWMGGGGRDLGVVKKVYLSIDILRYI